MLQYVMRKKTPPEDKKPPLYSLSDLTSDELIQQLKRLVTRQGELTAQVLAHVGEVDARKLYLRSACSSMFAYCTDVLKLPRGTTYKRICAARAARKHPAIFELVASGELHLSAVCLLAPHLTADNRDALLGEAAGCTKRQVEKLLAKWFPKPDVDTVVRALPRPRGASRPEPSGQAMPLLSQVAEPDGQQAQAPAGHTGGRGPDKPSAGATPVPAGPQNRPAPAAPAPAAPAPEPAVAARRRDELTPLSERRYKIQLTAGQSLHDKLMQAQELLGDRVAPGDLSTVLEQGLDLLLSKLRRQRFAETDRPRKGKGALSAAAPAPPSQPGPEPKLAVSRPDSNDGGRQPRYIPAEVRRTVARRDGHQCTFVDPDSGRRCPERSNLQYHHEHPWARGGSREAENIRILCRPHNLHLAEQDYGAEHIARRVHQARQSGKARRGSAVAGGDVVPGDAPGKAEPAAAPPGRSP